MDKAAAIAINNPYWEAVREHVDWTGLMPSVRWFTRGNLRREDYVSAYSWTIPDPGTLTFVAEHARGRVVDPMAGTGYWARLLTALDVDVVCYDLAPGTCLWHDGQPLHFEVAQMDAAEAVAQHPDRTLLLSWPPVNDAGTRTVRAYTGDRIIFIGQSSGGFTGDSSLFKEFEQHWTKIDSHIPVRWRSVHDAVTVYDRAPGDEP